MPLRFVALTCAGLSAALPATAEPEFLGRFLWEREEKYFGGLSGLELSDDGTSFFVIGDNAIVLTGTILRDGTRITGVQPEPTWIGGLTMPDGNRVREEYADAEGLAISEDGEIFVAFERRHRIWWYPDRDTPPVAMAALPEELVFRRNGGIEALALARDGAIWAVPERPPMGWDTLPVLRLADDGWTIAGTLPLDPVFRPVGADFADDGRLYLLERGFGIRGFSTRVRRLEVASGEVVGTVTVLQTRPGLHGNLEGLAVWRAASGALILTMVADDNYNWFQETEIVEYRVVE